MKKLVCIFFAFIVSFLPILPLRITAKAQSEYQYLRVINENTPFYKNIADQIPLFFLPYTYYVKVIGEKGDFVHVEISGSLDQPAIDGFVPQNALFFDGLRVEQPFLSLKITTITTTVLYQDAQLNTSIQYVFADRQLTYYGKAVSSQTNVLFVGYNDKLGYIKEEDVFPFTIPDHPNQLTFLGQSDTNKNQNNQTKTKNEFLGIRVTIIICLAFAGFVGLVIAIGKRKNPVSAPPEYYDENEYN